MPEDSLNTSAQFLSISRVARLLGVERRIVREAITRGSLDAVDLGPSVSGRPRYVTTASVRAYVARAQSAGAWSLRLCRKCHGERFIQTGSTMCSACADSDDEQARAEHRRARKREWWRLNGATWRAKQKAERDSPPPTEGKQR